MTDPLAAYNERHGVEALNSLTVNNEDMAEALTGYLTDRIRGKVVVEIGGGTGLLALHLGQVARRVYCIEANPMWTTFFVAQLYHHKPKHVSFLFGAAAEFAGQIRGDVALFCTHSDVSGMATAAALFAPVVIDVYGEMIERSPELFDPLASQLRAAT